METAPAENANFVKTKRSSVRIYLVLSVLILLVAALAAWGFWFLNKSSPTTTPPSLKIATTSLPPSTAKMVLSLIEKTNQKPSYLGYRDIYSLVLVAYLDTALAETRLVLEQIRLATKTAFPNQYQESDLVALCLDTSCLSQKPDPQIALVLDKYTQNATSVDQQLRLGTINRLKALGYYTDSERSYQAYQEVFALLKTSYQVSKNDQLYATATTLAALIKERYPEQYEKLMRYQYFEVTKLK